jgi:hypothetical protein
MNEVLKRADDTGAWRAVQVSYERYYGAKESLPPALSDARGFLCGDTYSHRHCRVSGEFCETFQTFLYRPHDNGATLFFEIYQPLTRTEYLALADTDIASAIQRGLT